MRVTFCSLKYSAGLRKEILVLARQAALAQCSVGLLLARAYEVGEAWPDAEVIYAPGIGGLRTFKPAIVSATKDLDAIVFYNSHPGNLAVARWIRQNRAGVRVIQYLHEPRQVNRWTFGFRGYLKYSAVEHLNRLLVKSSDAVIVLSPYGRALYQETYRHYRKPVFMVRLLQPDYPSQRGGERNVVALPGRLNRSKGWIEIFEAAQIAWREGLRWRFVILTATPSEAVGFARKRSPPNLAYDYREVLSDAAIAELLEQSFAVVLPHRQLVQSGNVPVAFRHHVPVVARDMPGARQDVADGETGVLVPVNCTGKDVLAALKKIWEAGSRMRRACRERYDALFSENRWREQYKPILDWIKGWSTDPGD